MMFKDAQHALMQLCTVGIEPFKDIKCEFGSPYEVAGHWFKPGDEANIPLSGFNGVYIYTSLEGEIWYIGKGEHESGGGIGQRCCSAHLGQANRDGGLMFPNHQWADQPIDACINDALKKGCFLLQTIKVGKKGCCSLVEVTLQTICLLKDGHLPPLNNKIG